MDMTNSDLLTPRETARILRISYPTIHRWIKSGKLYAIRVGRQWRIRREDVERILNPGPASG